MRALATTILLAFSISPVHAGLEFEIETRDFEFSPPRVERSTIVAEGVSMKMKSNDGRTGRPDTMIFRGDRQEMMVVDHQQRNYMIIDKQFAANMMGQLQQMAGQMANNQAQPNGQLARSQIEVSNTGQQAQVYGYPCTLFVVTSNGRKVRDVWVTNWNNIQGSRNLAATFSSMSDFTGELLASLPAQAQQQSPMQDNAFATISKMGGFPVASREYRPDGRVESESALRSAKSRQVSLQELQPPAGYQQQSMFGGSSMGAAPLGTSSANSGAYRQGRR